MYACKWQENGQMDTHVHIIKKLSNILSGMFLNTPLKVSKSQNIFFCYPVLSIKIARRGKQNSKIKSFWKNVYYSFGDKMNQSTELTIINKQIRRNKMSQAFTTDTHITRKSRSMLCAWLEHTELKHHKIAQRAIQ